MSRRVRIEVYLPNQMARLRRPRQQELPLHERFTWGGKRMNAGRKRTQPGRPGVSHHGRDPHQPNHPVHVTLRAVRKVGNLRAKKPFAVIREAIRAASSSRKDFRVVHFSVQRDHLHLIVEADDRHALGRGMQGLGIRIARRLNRLLHRKGRVFSDRYHRHDLKGPRETRNCVAYVLLNFRKHEHQAGRRCPRNTIDLCSSSPWFKGWLRPPVPVELDDERSPVADPETWFLKIGWRKWGLISPNEIPGLRV